MRVGMSRGRCEDRITSEGTCILFVHSVGDLLALRMLVICADAVLESGYLQS